MSIMANLRGLSVGFTNSWLSPEGVGRLHSCVSRCGDCRFGVCPRKLKREDRFILGIPPACSLATICLSMISA